MLRDIGSLLPYHSHVNPNGVVNALNHLIDEVNNGKEIFYDFYTESEKRAEPGRTNTGLFFVRGRPGAPFAIVTPGGGFSYVASVHEGFPVAVEISGKGFNAFVVVGEQDAIASPSVMQRRVDALRRIGTDVEFHKYPDLGHGFGPGTGTSAEGWTADAIRFWGQRISKVR